MLTEREKDEEPQVDQKSIKMALIKALGSWRSLGLADSELEIVRCRIELLVQKLEDCHASLDFAASRKLWRRLKAAVCSEECGSEAPIIEAAPCTKNCLKKHRSAARPKTE